MLTLFGVLMGMLLVFGSIGYATVSIWLPIVARWLENDPENPERFAATTKVGPNKGKFIMKGGEVVSMLTNIATHKQKGGSSVPEKFALVPLAPGEAVPQEYLSALDAYVYRYSGYRFFNPFSQKVYTYDFPRTETVMGENAELKVVGVTDKSDYFLLTEQTYSFSVNDADTGEEENVKVTLKGKVTFIIFNPHKAAFADRKWHQQAIAAIQVRGRNFTRSRDFNSLLGEIGEGGKEGDELKDTIGRDLAKVSKQIEGGPGTGTEELFGVIVSRVLVETIDMTDPEAEKSRTAKYTATRQAEVVSIAADAEANRRKTLRSADAEAEADYIQKITKATDDAGGIGLKLMDQQTQIKTAEAAETLIMNVGGAPGSVNPIDAEILKNMQRASPKKPSRQPEK